MVFEFQVCKYVLGEIQKPLVAQAILSRVSDGGVAAERLQDSRNEVSRRFRKSCKLQSTKSALDLQPSVTLLNVRGQNSNPRVELVPKEPRPTQSFHFVWKLISKTI